MSRPRPALALAPLASFAGDVHSQCGEDGIIEEVLRRLPERDRWCVEFGAWDGTHLSNTRKLIDEGCSAVLIEADGRRAARLAERYASSPAVTTLKGHVGWDGDATLDRLLAPTGIPAGFDLLSVDIDGNDYHVWSAVTEHWPKVVVIEYNPTIPDHVRFVQDADSSVRKGSSALALTELAHRKGYRLAATTVINLVFVREDLFDHMGVGDDSLAALRHDRSWELTAFMGYDGRLHVVGHRGMPWHRTWLPEEARVVPRLLDGFPGDFGPARKAAFHAWRTWRDKRDRFRC